MRAKILAIFDYFFFFCLFENVFQTDEHFTKILAFYTQFYCHHVNRKKIRPKGDVHNKLSWEENFPVKKTFLIVRNK
jgi:hypothetical protein